MMADKVRLDREQLQTALAPEVAPPKAPDLDNLRNESDKSFLLSSTGLRTRKLPPGSGSPRAL